MRRKIELYIDGALADLNDQALVLFNYALTDLQKPTAVKNSYSKQITLPGTPANDAIFSHAYRLDKMVGVSGFDPLTRTPFAIYDEKGDIVESGYLKLDKVSRKKGDHTYAVTLYGGLGSFFYALSYRSDGEKKTLADLKYTNAASFDDELDFTMTAANIKSNWNFLSGGGYTISFIPCYEGYPDGDFDANKAVALLASVGLPSQQTEGDVTYRGMNNGAIINLARNIDEWEAKDLRCYLQRPALKVADFIKALANSTYNGGFSLDYSGIINSVDSMYLTLPLLSSRQGIKQAETTYALTLTTGTGATSSKAADLTLPAGAVIAPFSEEKVKANVQVDFNNPTGSAGSGEYYSLQMVEPNVPTSGMTREHRAVFFAQVIGRDDLGNYVGASPVYTYAFASYNPSTIDTGESLATLCGYTPLFGDTYEDGEMTLVYDDYIRGTLAFSTEFECRGATSFFVDLKCYIVKEQFLTAGSALYGVEVYGGFRRPYWVKYVSADNYLYAPSMSSVASFISGSTNNVVAKTPSQARTGAIIKKADFLTTSYTPADLLVSLAKAFGWLFLADQKSKKITILSRDDFYNYGGDSVDLTERIDRSQEILVTPAYAGSKWYDLRYQEGGGAFWTDYKDRYGVQYGIQRVNTGYDFDSSPVNIMDGSVLRSGVSALAYGPAWNVIMEGTTYRPSVFIESGHTYTLFADDGTSKDFSVSRPSPSASITYYNTDHPGYDIKGADKLDLKNADGKGADGDGILVYYYGDEYNYNKVKVSDDSTLMLILNDGKPCWDLNPSAESIVVPRFTRFRKNGAGTQVTRSLEFGDVRELAIPDLTLGTDSSLYAAKWKKYLGDLLSEDTKVLTCKVHLDGLEVGPELLRRFFWYEGSYWVLNKINNYSLTTYDPAECEFVQVQDTDNYTDGQLW